jgi:hypothetical protein
MWDPEIQHTEIKFMKTSSLQNIFHSLPVNTTSCMDIISHIELAILLWFHTSSWEYSPYLMDIMGSVPGQGAAGT